MHIVIKNLTKEYDRVEGLRLDQERLIQREFLRFTAHFSNEEIIEQYEAILTSGKSPWNEISALVNNHIEQLANVLADAFINVARAEASIWVNRLVKIVKAEFDITDERVSSYLRATRQNFIRNLSRQQQAAIRQILVSGMQRGRTVQQLARSVAAVIGLTPEQARMVENYRYALENSDRSALSRELRDRRFDERVLSAVEESNPLTVKQIDRMVDTYARNLKRHRAQVIAQTESLKMTQQARRDAVRQIANLAGFDAQKVRKTWQTTIDGRERPSHRTMDGQTVAMDEPFVSPSGARLMHPGDTSQGAPPEEIVNCRCSVVYAFQE